MPAMTSSLLTVLFLVVPAPGLRGAEAAGSAVLPVSGFEEGLGVWSRSHGRCSIDEAVSRGGDASLRLDDGAAVRTDFLDLSGACWRLSFWMKTQDVVRGLQPWHRAGAQVSFHDAAKQPVGKGHSDIGMTLGTTEWTRYERTIYFPPKQGVRFVRIILMNWNCRGTTWFDDVELVSAPIPEAYRKVPLRSEVENQPPRTWQMPALRSVGLPRPPVEYAELTDRLPIRVLSHEFGVPELSLGGVSETGIDTDRGYMVRHVRRWADGPGPTGLRFERYDEFFRRNPIRSCFPRLWLGNREEVGALRQSVLVRGEVAKVRVFEQNRCVERGLGDEIVLGADTTKPFLILSDAEDSAGVILFHPIPAEVRRWYVEDYVVEREAEPRIALVRAGAGAGETDAAFTVRYDFGPIQAGAGGFCHSFDFYTFSMPYVGDFRDALAEFQLGRVGLLSDTLPFSVNEPRGYWQPHMGMAGGARVSRMARYFPREFTSWMDSSGWDYGHAGGHGWGCTNASMKGIRVNPSDPRALGRSYAWRMLTFFLTAAGPTGAPPNMYTWRNAAVHHEDLREHYTVVFCQYWEWRLGEFRAWLRSSQELTAEEKGAVYQDLQRARCVYDPAFAETTWTYPTPNGGYWFEYQDKPRGKRRWVINTQATSVGNVGDFALMARELGREKDREYWQRIFERGVDGLIYAWEQADMWTDYDPNEVRYARPPDGGPRGYHKYMVTAWTPKIVRVAMELGDYRLGDLLRYWRRMASAAYTTEKEREMVRPLMAEAEERLGVNGGG